MMNFYILCGVEENTVTKDEEKSEVFKDFDSVFSSKLFSGYPAP